MSAPYIFLARLYTFLISVCSLNHEIAVLL